MATTRGVGTVLTPGQIGKSVDPGFGQGDLGVPRPGQAGHIGSGNRAGSGGSGAGGGGGGGGAGHTPTGGTVNGVPASAFATVTSFLSQWGLQALAGWVWDRYRQLGGGSSAMNQIQLELPEQQAFQARFPAYKPLQAAGHAMSVAEMLSYENQAIGIMRAAGLPSGFYDQPQDLAKFMSGQVSVNELQSRVSLAQQAAMAPHEAKDALGEMYGLKAGDLTAYFLDPDKALPVLTQKFQAGELGGIAKQTGFGNLNAQDAERLVSLGVDQNQGQSGFSHLTALAPLMASDAQEQANVDQQTQLAAQFQQDQGALSRIQRRQQRRNADFGGTSGLTANQGGVGGLGSSGQ